MNDVVYVVGPDGDHEDLRYSLRSLHANVDHGRVWIVGDLPGWARNVGHIPTRQHRSKFRNSTGNLLAACRHPDVSPRFAYFNDDFFAVAPTGIPSWHRGPVHLPPGVDAGTRHKAAYRDGMAATVWLLEQWGHDRPYDWDLHVPMTVASDRMVQVLEAAAPAGIEALHKRTLYATVCQLAGYRHPDVKVADLQTTWADSQPWVSTTDESFTDGAVGRRIRALFPDPSPYEEEPS